MRLDALNFTFLVVNDHSGKIAFLKKHCPKLFYLEVERNILKLYPLLDLRFALYRVRRSSEAWEAVSVDVFVF